MRSTIDVDDDLLAKAHDASGLASRQETVEAALRLMIRLRRQAGVGQAFGRYPWSSDADRSGEPR
jgi:Arc/MetJ family transcription regulator